MLLWLEYYDRENEDGEEPDDDDLLFIHPFSLLHAAFEMTSGDEGDDVDDGEWEDDDLPDLDDGDLANTRIQFHAPLAEGEAILALWSLLRTGGAVDESEWIAEIPGGLRLLQDRIQGMLNSPVNAKMVKMLANSPDWPTKSMDSFLAIPAGSLPVLPYQPDGGSSLVTLDSDPMGAALILALRSAMLWSGMVVVGLEMVYLLCAILAIQEAMNNLIENKGFTWTGEEAEFVRQFVALPFAE